MILPLRPLSTVKVVLLRASHLQYELTREVG